MPNLTVEQLQQVISRLRSDNSQLRQRIKDLSRQKGTGGPAVTQIGEILAKTGVSVWAIDLHGHFLMCAGRVVSELEMDEVPSPDSIASELLAPWPRVLETLNEALAGTATETEIRADANRVRFRFVPQRSAGDDVTYVIGIIETRECDDAEPVDPTREASDESAQSIIDGEYSATWLRAIIDHARDFIATIDPQGRITFINHVVPPYTKETVIGHAAAEFVPENQQEAFRQAIQQVFDTNEALTYELEAYGPNRQLRWYSSRMAPIEIGGRVVSLISLITDITEAKQARENERRWKQRLETAWRSGTMGELAAELAHQLNNPLCVIANYANGCIRQVEDGQLDRAAAVQILRNITVEAERASQSLKRIRKHVRQRAMDASSQNPHQLIDEAVKLCHDLLSDHNVQIELNLMEAPPNVIADEIQIVQVLSHLLLNACEAMESTAVDDRVIRIQTSRAASMVRIDVEDRGCGIDELNQRDLFAPFKEPRPNHLGLGLAVSKSIVEAHQGRLWAESALPHGAVFHLELPESIWGEAAP